MKLYFGEIKSEMIVRSFPSEKIQSSDSKPHLKELRLTAGVR